MLRTISAIYRRVATAEAVNGLYEILEQVSLQDTAFVSGLLCVKLSLKWQEKILKSAVVLNEDIEKVLNCLSEGLESLKPNDIQIQGEVGKKLKEKAGNLV